MTSRRRLPSLAVITALFCCLTLTALAIPLVVTAGNVITNVMVSRADRDMIDRLNAEAVGIDDRLSVRRQVLSDIAERPDIVQGVVQTGKSLNDARDRLRGTKLLGTYKSYALYDFEGRILHPIQNELMTFAQPLQKLAKGLVDDDAASSYYWCDLGERGRAILIGVPIKFRGAIEGTLVTVFSINEIRGSFPGELMPIATDLPAGWYAHQLDNLPVRLALQ